jgi:subfamily B ATP-binding cassette protein MsbA
MSFVNPRRAVEPAPHESVSLRNLWRFMGYLLPYWRSLSGGIITGLQRMILHLSMGLFLERSINWVGTPYIRGEISFDTAWTRMGWMLAIMVLLLVQHFFASLGRTYLSHRAGASATRDIRFDLFSHLQRLSLGFHSQRATGGIVARVIADVESAAQAYDLVLIQMGQHVMRALVILVILLWMDWQWALVAFALTPLFALTTHLVRKPMRQATRRQREKVEEMSGLVQERFSMIREVQSFTAEPYEDQQVLGRAEQVRQHTMRQQLYNGLMMGGTEDTRFACLVVVVTFGIYRMTTLPTEAAQQVVGFLPAFYMYTMQALHPMQFFANLYTQMQMAAAAADRVFQFLDTEPDIVDRGDEQPLAASRAPRVAFECVSFAYPTDDPAVVLDDVTFEVAGGSKAVLVGSSGAGKSTLMSLIPRFYDVQQGCIRVDGTDIRQATIQSVREAAGIVPQEPVLFSGTIRENIQYGRRDASEADIEAAARMANAAPFIEALAQGYDTVVGERGIGLSGGQIQRVAIARAFLKDPPILIMDEPTSNLDANSEALVMDALDRLAQGRTTFIIAHRLSLARDADLIVTMDGGRVVEIGSHDQLLAQSGLYADLWHRQVGVTP